MNERNAQLNNRNAQLRDRNELLNRKNVQLSRLTELANGLKRSNLANRLKMLDRKDIVEQLEFLDALIIEFGEKLKVEKSNRMLRTQTRQVSSRLPNLNWCEECINALDPEACVAQNKGRLCRGGEVCMEETRGTPTRVQNEQDKYFFITRRCMPIQACAVLEYQNRQFNGFTPDGEPRAQCTLNSNIEESVCRCCCDRASGCSTLSCHETDTPRSFPDGAPTRPDDSMENPISIDPYPETTTPMTRLLQLSTDRSVDYDLNGLAVVNESDFYTARALMMDVTSTPLLTVKILGASHDKLDLNSFKHINDDQTNDDDDECQQWTQWNTCSTSCGGGFRDRSRTCGGRTEWDNPEYCNSVDCPDLECPDTYFNVVIGLQQTSPKKTQMNKTFAKKLLKQWGRVYRGIDNKKALMFTFGANSTIRTIFNAQTEQTSSTGKFIKNIRHGNAGNFTSAVLFATEHSVHRIAGYTNIAIFVVDDETDYDYDAVLTLKQTFQRVIVISHRQSEPMKMAASWPINENYHDTTLMRYDSFAKRIAYQTCQVQHEPGLCSRDTCAQDSQCTKQYNGQVCL